jgi:membrane-anchored mycosin MYCP
MRIPRALLRLTAASAVAVLAGFGPLAYADTSGPPQPPPPNGAALPNQPPGPPGTPVKVNRVCPPPSGAAGKVDTIPWGQRQLQYDQIRQVSDPQGRTIDGSGQKVAVIDTGVRPHSQLEGRLAGGGDFFNPAANGLQDCDGHGTIVAGIIAAYTGGATGFTGIAPGAQILSIRQTSSAFEADKDPNTGVAPPLSTVGTLARAVMAAANNGATVINISLTSCPSVSDATKLALQDLRNAVHYAVRDKNIVVVAAAGNFATEADKGCPAHNNDPDPSKLNVISIPGWFADDVLSVAAVDEKGNPADFTIEGPWVSVAAPGTEIVSLAPDNDGTASLLSDGKQQNKIQGTSFAAPYVSGLAALIKQRFPNLSAVEVMDRIKKTAQHPAGITGRNNQLGYGMINPVAALTAIVPGEAGVPVATAGANAPGLPYPIPKNWQPMQVALIGTAGGIALLLITLFVVRAVQRDRRNHEARPTLR